MAAFWFFDSDLRVAAPETCWEQSNAIRRGPPLTVPAKITIDGVTADEGVIILDRERQSTVEAFLIRPYHDDVVSMLQEVGLLQPPKPKPATVAESSTSTEAAAQKLMAPKDWFKRACKTHQRHKNEGTVDYADRLLESMKKAPVRRIWSRQTMIRRINDRK